MRRPSPKAESIRRRKNRERMRKARERARRKRRCRQCERPVTVSERTGRPAATCRKHLLEDRARKTPVELLWLDHDARDQAEADKLAAKYPGGRFDFRQAYPLRWFDELGEKPLRVLRKR